MKIIIKTLVDISETGARRGTDPIKSKQQDNYNTAIQTAGFRANLEPKSCKKFFETIDGMGFGSDFKGTQAWWELSLYCEYKDAISEDLLIKDFDLVPIISGLEETSFFAQDIFRTTDAKQRNILFIISED